MKKLSFFFVILLVGLLTLVNVSAKSAKDEIARLGKDIAELKLGFGDYFLGEKLTQKQQELAKKNAISKTLKGTYKFYDDDVYVVAKSDDNMVLGIYKEYAEASREEVKTMIGDLMMKFEEPTTMAHDKVIYWAFDKNGKIEEDEYNFSKQTGEIEMIASVKLQSTQAIRPDTPPEEKKGEQEVEQVEEKSFVYVLISSNPLSKIFLASNQ